MRRTIQLALGLAACAFKTSCLLCRLPKSDLYDLERWSGNWSDSTKWTNGVPTANANAYIDGGNSVASPVTLDVSGARVTTLRIDSDDSLSFNNGTSLGTYFNLFMLCPGYIDNNGKITLNSTGSATSLIIYYHTFLNNYGTITLTDSANPQDFIKGGGTLDNYGTIQGAGNNALSKFATNAAGGSFSLQAGRAFTTTGNFSNAGTFTILSDSTFTVGGSGVFTQTGGKTTDDGTLTDSSGFSLNGGSLFGKGTITGAVTSSGAITPGDSSTATGILKDTGAYTQKPAGTLDISIDGTTAGTQYDQLNPTTASLNGTLNINRPTGFVPTIGSKFKIMNFTSENGKFATVNGLAINSTEHFTITYQGTDVLLTVVSGPCCAPQFGSGLFNGSLLGSLVGPTYDAGAPGRFGFGLYGRGRNFPHLNPRLTAMAASSLGRLQTSPNPYLGLGAIAKLASIDFVSHPSVLSRRAIAAFAAVRTLSAGTAPHSFIGVGANRAVRYRMNPAGGLPRNNGRAQRMMAPKSLAYHLDLLSILGASPRQLWRGLLGLPGSPSATSFGYLTFQ